MFDRRRPLALCRRRPVTLVQGAVTCFDYLAANPFMGASINETVKAKLNFDAWLAGTPDKTARIHEKVAVRKTFGRSWESAGLSFWDLRRITLTDRDHPKILQRRI